MARPRVSKELNYVSAQTHFAFFLLVTSFGMLNSKKWVGVGVGRLLKRAVPKNVYRVKVLLMRRLPFIWNLKLKKMFRRKKPSCSLDTKFFFVSLELTTFIFGNSLSKCSVVLLTKKFVKFCWLNVPKNDDLFERLRRRKSGTTSKPKI